MRTEKEIQDEITALRELKPRVPYESMFGDNNHNAIEAQIETLESDLVEDDIYEKLENEEWLQNEESAALDARQWMDGDSEDKPSESWKPLAK